MNQGTSLLTTEFKRTMFQQICQPEHQQCTKANGKEILENLEEEIWHGDCEESMKEKELLARIQINHTDKNKTDFQQGETE